MVCALIVDEKLDAIALDYLVAGLFFIQRHFVVQARTTPSRNVNTEPFTPATAGLFSSKLRSCRAAFWVTLIMVGKATICPY